jgi:D-alanyl-D-alanine dipeptidase
MKNSLLLLLYLTISCKSIPKSQGNPDDPFQSCRQLVLVVSPDDTTPAGILRRFEKKENDWQPVGQKVEVTLGRTGLAWGRGLHDAQMGYQKKEGDGKSPAGIFKFGTVFGYAPPAATDFKMPYVQSTSVIECVDDVHSVYYNQLINSQLYTKDWKSSEMMRRPDEQYKWGMVVEHNQPAQAGSGSCIFLHIWSAPGAATSGCTAMTEENLLELLRWLDPIHKPLLLQVSEKSYPIWKKKYALPDLL